MPRDRLIRRTNHPKTPGLEDEEKRGREGQKEIEREAAKLQQSVIKSK